MQKLLLLLITMIIGFFTSVTVMKGQDFRNKKGVLETKTIVLEHFDRIDFEMVFDVEVKRSNEEKALITSNYMRFLDIKVKNNVLQIGYKRNQSMENVDTKIVIYAKDVKSVSASVGSVVKIKDNFNIEKFYTESGGKIFADSDAVQVSVSTQSGGYFSGTLNTENLSLNAQSGSLIEIKGKIGTAKIISEGASKILAGKTNISIANVTAESASSVNISVSKQLTASASSMAKIRYKTLSGIKFSAARDSGGTIDSI